jgi:hypothetical protein
MELETLNGNASEILRDYVEGNFDLSYDSKYGWHWVFSPFEGEEPVGKMAINDECFYYLTQADIFEKEWNLG